MTFADVAPGLALPQWTIDTADSPWRQLAREVLAYSDYKAGNIKEATFTFQALARDPVRPRTRRQLARMTRCY